MSKNFLRREGDWDDSGDLFARPNVIFLMTDQQRWDALGVENSSVLTPNLDRLAREGIRFREAVCQAPMCVPSRNSMMTGLYPSQLGVRRNGDGTPDDLQLPHPVFPEFLRRAGYQTAGFGKTHWGRMRRAPSTRGFDVRVVGCREMGVELGATGWQDDENPAGLAAYREETASYGPGEEESDGYLGCRSTLADRDHRDGWIAEKCREWLLSDGPDPSRPLFLYLSFLKPHAGLNVPGQFEDLYSIDQIPDIPLPPWANEAETHLAAVDRANDFLGERYRRWVDTWEGLSKRERRWTTLRYWANCSWLDSLFGQVLDALGQKGYLENALIVFVSDHGEMLGERHHRFSKYCLYDSSIRVPLILSGSALPERWRGVISERPAELVDLFPTLCNLARAEMPDALPGEDLLSAPTKRGTFCELHDAGQPAWMWRTEAFKLIVYRDPETMAERGELYDLTKDPDEWTNLYNAAGYEKIQAELLAALTLRVASVHAGRPAFYSNEDDCR